jgi:hypothetical protein
MAQPAHRTVSLHEWHLVGPDGLPARHRTQHVLRALEDGVEAFTFRFDRAEGSVRALHGAVASEPYADPGTGLTAVDLVFPRSLAAGETATLVYETTFRWRAVPPPHVRRASRQRVERLDMRVEFSPERLPAELQWAVWEGFGPDARLVAAERVELDAEHAVHRFVDALDNGTVGFSWTWPPGREPVAPAP